MKDIAWDDYVLAQIDRDSTTIRALLGVERVHAIGYCVAGTTLAATLSLLARRGQADKVRERDLLYRAGRFSPMRGELANFVTDDQLALIETLSPDGYLDGRYMAATFNALRGARPDLELRPRTITCSARTTPRSTCSTGTAIRRTCRTGGI